MGSRRGNLPGKLTQPRKITRNSYAGQQQQPGTAVRMHISAAPTAQHGRCQASGAAGRTREWLAVSTATCFYMVRNWHLARICGWLPARRRACLSAPLYKNNPLEERIDGTNVRTGFKNPVGPFKWALPRPYRRAPARAYSLGQRQRSSYARRPGGAT